MYKNITKYYAPTFGANGIIANGSKSSNNYYVSKSNTEEVFNLGDGTPFTKNFKKAASNYFKDCPTLFHLIKNNEYKIKDIVKIVEFYNENCNKYN